MSLLVWLPLNGDLHNLGLNNVTVMNNGATVNNNGKIGKCYQFGTAASDILIPATAMASFTTECSICFWIKILSWNTSYATFFLAGISSTAWTAYIFGLLRNNANSNCCFTISNGSSASNASYLTPTLELNTWYHLGLIYKTGHCLIYVNGLLYQDYTTSIVPKFNGINVIRIGRCTNGSSYLTNCLLNDFRIYNHALSAAEVEEIAKGLILHYLLNGFVNGVNDNLLLNSQTFGTGWSGSGTTTQNAFQDYYAVKYKNNSSGTSVNDAVVYSNATTVSPNEVYTGSFYAKADTTSTLTCYFYNNSSGVVQVVAKTASNGTTNVSSDGATTFTIDSTWRRYWVTWTFGSTGNAIKKHFIVCRLMANASGISISKVKLEKGNVPTAYTPAFSEITNLNNNIIYDSSGYNNNATLVGILGIDTISPKYNVSTVFNGSTYGNMISPVTTDSMLDEFTFSCWIKRNYTETTVRYIYNGIVSVYLYSDFKVRIAWQAANADLSYNTANAWAPNMLIPNLEWHFISFVLKNSVFYAYLDGELVGTSARNTYIRGYKGTLLAGITTTSPLFIGNISDLRVYTTSLTAAQIKELYRTSMIVDGTAVRPRDLE